MVHCHCDEVIGSRLIEQVFYDCTRIAAIRYFPTSYAPIFADVVYGKQTFFDLCKHLQQILQCASGQFGLLDTS